MNGRERVEKLIAALLDEMPQYKDHAGKVPADAASRRRLLRALMNVRPPGPLDDDFVALQDELLSAETEERGVVDGSALPPTSDPRIVLWQGDITRLKVDAIVNAANSALRGCFVPNHACIDNVIHSAAGLQLREECDGLMRAQGNEEPVGQAKITLAYNLPCKHVIHTVGPMITGPLTEADRDQLASCYRSCLQLAEEHSLRSIAFCCISTGVFRFPNDIAAEIAVHTVRDHLRQESSIKRVVFDVFRDEDLKLYQSLLKSRL